MIFFTLFARDSRQIDKIYLHGTVRIATPKFNTTVYVTLQQLCGCLYFSSKMVLTYIVIKNLYHLNTI